MMRSKYSSLMGTVIALALLFGLDKWLDRQARLARLNSDYQSYMIWIIMIGLAIGVVWFLLSWLTLLKSERSYLISIIFIFVGLIVYIYPVLYLWNPAWIAWLSLPYLYGFNAPVAYTGIFIAVLGLLHLSLPK